MDEQNDIYGFDNNQDTNTTSTTEPTSENVTESISEPAGEIVNVNTDSTFDNGTSYSSYSYQNDTTNTSSYNYQGDNTNTDSYNYQGSNNNSSYNYQDNTAQYYATPVYANDSNQQGESTPGFAIASLVLGIVSILFCCCSGGGIVFAIPGIIMGLSANKKHKTGVGTSGIICSIVGAVFNGLTLLYIIGMFVISMIAAM